MQSFHGTTTTLCVLAVSFVFAACELTPTAAGDASNGPLSFMKGGGGNGGGGNGGGGNGGGGNGGGGNGGCSTTGLSVSFDEALTGFGSDGAVSYVDGVDGVLAEIQCDGNFDIQLRNGLKKKDPTIRFVNAHVTSVDGSFPDIGPSLEETRFKSGNEFDLTQLGPGQSTQVGLSVTWEAADGVRYQIRYGDAFQGTFDCAVGGVSWDDPMRFVNVSRSADGATWTFDGSEGLLCADAQPQGIGSAPFQVTAVEQP